MGDTPSRPTARTAGADLEPEWTACHHHARDRTVAVLRTLGAGPATLEHASGLRLYYRVAFLLSCWAADADDRRRLCADLALHVVAMKLLDDLMDDDSGLDRFELGIGSLRLLLLGTERLAAAPDDACRAVLEAQEEAFRAVCSGQLRCKREPATDLDSWLRYADDYGARFLGLYGRLGGLGAGLGQRAEVPERFAWGFGLIITIADDLTDFTRHGERIGNIGALLLDGKVQPLELEGVLRRERRRALDAAAELPTAYDLRPVVEAYYADVVERILPRLLRASAAAP